MMIFYKEVPLQEGFEISRIDKNSRVVAGREVSTAAGFRLFDSLQDQPIKCFQCGCAADRWISTRNQNDHSRPVLNLFGLRNGQIVMITRDHIIPKSEGGIDDIANLRPACEICNFNRASSMNDEEIAFMKAHPELISQERLEKARKAAERMRLEQQAAAERVAKKAARRLARELEKEA